MSSQQLDPQVGKTSPAPLRLLDVLRDNAELRRENRRLRRRVAALEESRERWRSESRAWQWGYLTSARRRTA